MASSHSVYPLAICFLIMHFISLPLTILSQDPSSSNPFIAQCTSTLLPLVPCGPYVQGTIQSPAPPCCDNLKQLYSQEPQCLCLLLNNNTLGTFPINTTLALQLPDLCGLQVDITACPGLQLPPILPAPQVSFGTHPNSTIAASPVVQVAPRPIMGLGFGRSTASELKIGSSFIVKMAMITFLLTIS